MAAFGICMLYVAGVLVGAALCGPTITPWFLAGWSAAFVWVYLALVRGRPIVALSIVTVVTVVLPVFALFALVWPAYRSPPGVVQSLWSEFRGPGLFAGLELFVPLVAAGVIAAFTRHGEPDAHFTGA